MAGLVVCVWRGKKELVYNSLSRSLFIAAGQTTTLRVLGLDRRPAISFPISQQHNQSICTRLSFPLLFLPFFLLLLFFLSYSRCPSVRPSWLSYLLRWYRVCVSVCESRRIGHQDGAGSSINRSKPVGLSISSTLWLSLHLSCMLEFVVFSLPPPLLSCLFRRT